MGLGSSRHQQNDAEQVADVILGQDVVAAGADENLRIRRHLLRDAGDPGGNMDDNVARGSRSNRVYRGRVENDASQGNRRGIKRLRRYPSNQEIPRNQLYRDRARSGAVLNEEDEQNNGEDPDPSINDQYMERRDEESNIVDDVDIEDVEEDEFDEILHTPKRRKLRTTSRYIFETLFLEGRDSDITVNALNREWKLHKLYLRQSPYFRSMFSGSWRESTMEKIDIHIVDPNVDLNALHVALGSLYQDEISVEPAEAIPILAAANLFQLDGLIDQCVAIMEETINVKTVARYYDSASFYGATQVERACLAWLKVNLLSHMPEHPERLRDISTSLMVSLISSSDLFVMQTEFSVYVLLRLWLFLIFHQTWDGNPQDAVLMSHKYFQERVKTSKKYFLETPEGQPYVNVFKKLRFNHLVNHHMDMEMLLTDRIIPRKWMYPVYQNQWQLLLRTDQGIDRGPQNFTPEDFDKVCLRCGRTLNVSGQQHMWRWTGFNMGLDLIVTYDNGSLSLKRNLSNASTTTGNGVGGANGEHEALLSNHKKRHVYFRVSVASLNEQKQVVYRCTSDIQSVSLSRNNSHQMLRIDTAKATFPLLLSFSFAVSTPLIIKDEDSEDENVSAESDLQAAGPSNYTERSSTPASQPQPSNSAYPDGAPQEQVAANADNGLADEMQVPI